jgi:GNAT superfamily N-acetyltransferase
MPPDSTTPVTVRRATTDDIDDLVRLRIAMQKELDEVEAHRAEHRMHAQDVLPETHAFFQRTLPSGEFVSFVAEADGPVVACSGMVFYTVPPLPVNPDGREALLMNMYTEPGWRKRGIGRQLLEALMTEARSVNSGRVWLRASAAGRPLYESYGFEGRDYYMQILGGA